MKSIARKAISVEMSPLFDGLHESNVRAILAQRHLRSHKPGEFIFRQGFPATDIVLIQKGVALMSDTTSAGDRLILRWLKPGDSFGCAALLEGREVYPFALEAFTEIETLHWSRTVFLGMMALSPRLMENVLKSVNGWLRVVLERLELLSSASVEQRVAMLLIQSAEQIGKQTRAGIELRFYDEQLAQMAGTTLFSVSRLMQCWERSGLLKKTRGCILIYHGSDLGQLMETAKSMRSPEAGVDSLRKIAT